MWTVQFIDHFSSKMGRPKRKLSPLKTDSKVRKLSAFGFCKDRESQSRTENDVVVKKNGEISSFEVGQLNNGAEMKIFKQNEKIIRKFRPEWKHTRDWLEYDAKNKLMFCTLCKNAKMVNSFVSGCSSLKIENIRSHENPKGKKVGENSHIRALEIMKETKEYETARSKQLQSSEAAVIGAMKNVAFMASHDLPNSIMKDLNELCIEQGASNLKSLKCDDHTSYEHNSSVAEFQKAIAEVITDELVEAIKKSPYFSVTLDESTDIGVKQNLIVYVMYLVKEKGKMITKNDFVGIVHLEKGATAQNIFDALIDLLTRRGVDCSKLAGIATDGAAVMTGIKSGVVQKVKEHTSGVLSVHCIAHRLALSSGGAADSIMYLVKFQEIVNALYKYFEYSPKHTNPLKEMQVILDQKQKLKLKQIFHTRWLSFDGALQAVIVNYSSLLSVLLSDNSAKAAGLVKSMSTYKFLYTAHFLSDVMHYLCRLSKSYQSSNINFSSVYSLLENTLCKIKSLENGSGKNITAFLKCVPYAPVESDIQGIYQFEFGSHIIKDSVKQRKEAAEICLQFCQKVKNNLEARFDPTGDSSVLTAVSNVFDPRVISNADEPGCKVEIEREVKVVSDFIQKINPQNNIYSETFEFLDFVKSNDRKFALMNNVDDLCQYAISEKVLFPQVADVALRYLVAPVSTVDCERGFSRHNLIKTKTRNCLKTESVENLMIISIRKPTFDFPFHLAFKKWVDVKKRRIM